MTGKPGCSSRPPPSRTTAESFDGAACKSSTASVMFGLSVPLGPIRTLGGRNSNGSGPGAKESRPSSCRLLTVFISRSSQPGKQAKPMDARRSGSLDPRVFEHWRSEAACRRRCKRRRDSGKPALDSCDPAGAMRMTRGKAVGGRRTVAGSGSGRRD